MMRWTLLLAMVLVAAGVLLSGLRLEHLAGELPEQDELLYLPNGKHLKLASLGQASVLADLIYIWAIQYYSIYEREDRFRYVEHVFGDVIAELDPRYIDPYWMGALILSVEAHDLEAALHLLETGFERNPDQWILPYLAAWECHHAGQPERALDYFRIAAAVPGAPPQVQRLQIGMVSRLGDYRAAIAMWELLLEDPQTDQISRAIAKRQLRQLRREADLDVLRAAISEFRKENGRPPHRLAELVEHHYISTLPQDSQGRDYLYDPSTGRLLSPKQRVLGVSR